MRISSEDARDMVYGDNPDFETIETTIVSTTRWATVHKGVFQHISSGKLYCTDWREPATERQCEQPFEGQSEVELEEVVGVETTVTKYVPIEGVKELKQELSFSEVELKVLARCFHFVDNGNIGFDAIQTGDILELNKTLDSLRSELNGY